MKVLREVDLQALNTLGLPATAESLTRVASVDEARDALAWAEVRGCSLTVIGGGSNLVLQPWLPGLVVVPSGTDWHLEPLAGDDVRVQVAAGVNWHRLVVALAEQGLWGTENLALIPGLAGAAPIQNIGAYGVELAEVLEAVHLIERDTLEARVLTREECAFGYRDSVFKQALAGRVIITRLVLRVSRRPRPRLDYGDLAARVPASPSAADVVAAVSAVRREKLPDPAVLGNAGSFFTNPVIDVARAQRLLDEWPGMPHFPLADGRVKLAAGWLIDRSGLKGLRDGHVGVHDRQALVLVHHGGGSAAELLALAERVAAMVEARFGVRLTREPRVLGEAVPGKA
ncbi:UDP-N-acetylmuramate dehydrogenase [Modicisalibacter tunisiensis]|uniref:UDP-N-acetylenolpyruvoylglucosamine reductase n=1 Tax=Modicisalibacter tunisiensis TaxID=390637 RepID=A0ABS7WZJ8_9GAMM|nr:UDP-N-acetylmuramate dehydrogenase [Modicisalibacter tunisiensis]MBZ9538525.1 UDP-N-acetylmuramate dehydrogenase [Modicisalibacter tunisiensis]MBZ9568062.1 UDP-N-acetylmuramate dehydrogenase [Modicisalibacter tunisiensis]